MQMMQPDRQICMHYDYDCIKESHETPAQLPVPGQGVLLGNVFSTIESWLCCRMTLLTNNTVTSEQA